MKKILRNTWRFLDKNEKKKFGILIILDIVISILDILFLVLLLWIIQFYVQHQVGKILFFLPGWLVNKNPILFITVFFFLFGLKNLAGFLITRAQNKFIGAVAIRISKNNLFNYQQSGFEEFVSVDSSVHIRKIGFQPFEFCQYILSGTQQIITQTCLIIIAITAIILFNAKLFLLLLLILLPPVFALFFLIKKHLNTARSNIRSNNEKSFQYLLDALKGYVEGNIYNRNNFFMQRFIKYRRMFSKYLFDSISLQSLPGRLIELFAVLGLFILIAIAIWSGNKDSAALITVGAFMAAAYKIIPGIVKLINISGQIKAYEFSLADLVQNTRIVHEELHKPEGIHSLQLNKVSFHYGELPVLKNFHLTIKKGDFVGITGASGKGKTTILNIVLGFLKPEHGEIIFNDSSVNGEEIKKYWPSISYVRQQSFFIHDTILRNITLEEDGQNKQELEAALHISGLNDFIAKFPEGLDKIITENGKNISGGQQQRIALARAVYKKADLFLLDEPFNELDEKSEVSLLGHFLELSKNGKMVIIITHDKKSLAYCTKIISLDEQS